MTTAICLSGLIKYPENSINSIKKIHPDDMKIFIHTWNMSDLSRIKDFNYESCIIEDYGPKEKEFNLLHRQYTNRIIADDTWIGEQRTDVGIFSMFYSMYKSNQLKSNYEKTNGITFDKVIRMRFDSKFLGEKLNLSDFDDNLFIPVGCDWCGGINDQFALGPSDKMDIYSDVYNNMMNLDCKYHPERIMSAHLKKMNLSPKRFIFDVAIRNSNTYHREV